MKKIFVLLLVALALFLVGCGADGSDTDGDAPLRVIATIFPQFDFVRQIAGDRVELSMLLSPGAESHGFEPSPRDIVALNNADLLIYIGGHGDGWVARILNSLDNENIRAVNMLGMVDAVMAEHHHHGHGHGHDNDCGCVAGHDCCADGHECCNDENCDHGHGHHHGHGHDHSHGHHHHGHGHGHHHGHNHHEPHYDEHVWTCPRNAILIVQALTDILSEKDPDNAYYFRANADAYIVRLQELDAAFAEVAQNAARRTVIFGDRFPFQYLMDTYGLTAYAAFHGCSAETQASPATIAFLINKVRDENIPVVFHIEFSNQLIANTIAGETGARILELHSLHNVSHADFNAGVTYIDLMLRNVEMLREALN